MTATDRGKDAQRTGNDSGEDVSEMNNRMEVATSLRLASAPSGAGVEGTQG